MGKPLKCLLVEDSEFDAVLLLAELSQGGYDPEVERVETAESMRGALARSQWDVVFSDYVLPQFDAPSAYRVFRECHGKTPFIIVSGEIGEDLAVESLKFGADDYILKHNLKRLVPATQRALRNTEHRRQRDAARHMNELIMANSLDMICTVDGDYRFVEVSAACKRILQYEPAELVGRKFIDFLHPEDLERSTKEAEVVRGGRVVFQFENRYLRKDGEIVHLSWSAHWSEADQLFFCVGRDITEQKLAEEALQQSESMFRMMVEQVVDYAILTLDPNGRIKTWNAGAARTKGYLAEEIMGQSHSRFYTLEDIVVGKPTALLQRASIEGRVADEGWRVRKDGTRFWASVIITAIHDSKGHLRGFTKVTHDLTGRKQAEENRLRMEAQLRQAQKLEALGQLAAGIAHEINTPTQFTEHNLLFLRDAFPKLTDLVRGHGRLLSAASSGPVPEVLLAELRAVHNTTELELLAGEIPNALEEALVGTDRITKIVRAMKEFSHPGGSDGRPEPTDLNRAISNTVMVARNEWKHVAEVHTEFDKSMPPIPVFAGEFNQVILNLLVNAAHAIAEVKGRNERYQGAIIVTTQRTNGWAEVRIRDNGSGIPSHVKHRVFEPFFTTKDVGKGTGQGLALARSIIVEKHRGELNFETEENKGTCFILRLPLHANGTAHPKHTRELTS